MSFILDALRKSEAARRRSETPDLFSTMHDAPAPAREHANAPVWIVGVVGVLSLGVATWLFLQREPARDAPVAAPVAAPAPAPVGPMRSGDATPVAPPPEVASASETPPATIAPPPAASVRPAPASDVGASPASQPPERPAPVPDLPAPPPTIPTPKNGDRAIALSELDAGSRKQLPALKMSMHMWNEDAQRRFVILDGQRLGEGDMIGQATVESITRDGVVLNWQGARVRIDTR